MAVCPNADWDTWKTTIESAIASVQIPDRLRYQPHQNAGSASGASPVLGLLLVFGLVLTTLIAWFVYNRNCGEVMSDEI